jgi:hypothetical protein
LRHIDLMPLAACPQLRRLGLAMNAIEELDLSPLASAKNLTALDVAGNRLTSIDLNPLAKCKELTELYLHSDHPQENRFGEINITPLFKCTELEDVSIGKETRIVAKASLENSKDIPSAIEEIIDDGRVVWV